MMRQKDLDRDQRVRPSSLLTCTVGLQTLENGMMGKCIMNFDIYYSVSIYVGSVDRVCMCVCVSVCVCL